MTWLQNRPKLVQLASDLIFFCEKQGFGLPPSGGGEVLEEAAAVLEAPVDPYLRVMEASSITNYARVQHQAALKHEKLAASEGLAQRQVEDSRRKVAEACLVRGVDYKKLMGRVQELQRDCTALENKCVELVTFLDKYVHVGARRRCSGVWPLRAAALM